MESSVAVTSGTRPIIPADKAYTISWCLLNSFITSTVVSVWETSAAIVTQRYFGWTVVQCSLFIGAVFIVSMAGGELFRVLQRRRSCICEGDASMAGVVAVVLGSATLYWYCPDGAPTAAVASNQVVYMLGSCLVMVAANLARTYAFTTSMRAAASVGVRQKDRVNAGLVTSMMFGRGFGAFCGMGFASTAQGADAAGGIVTLAAALLLALLGSSAVRSGLRST